MRTLVVLIMVLAVVCAFVDPAFAGGGKSFKRATIDSARAGVNYPSYLVSETVGVVGAAGRGFVNAIGGAVRYTGETLVGKGESAKKIVTTPMEGSFRTIKDATVGTVQAPIKAGRKTKERW
jgi:hypothetical protein